MSLLINELKDRIHFLEEENRCPWGLVGDLKDQLLPRQEHAEGYPGG